MSRCLSQKTRARVCEKTNEQVLFVERSTAEGKLGKENLSFEVTASWVGDSQMLEVDMRLCGAFLSTNATTRERVVSPEARAWESHLSYSFAGSRSNRTRRGSRPPTTSPTRARASVPAHRIDFAHEFSSREWPRDELCLERRRTMESVFSVKKPRSAREYVGSL